MQTVEQIKALFEEGQSGNHVLKIVNGKVVYVYCEYRHELTQYCWSDVNKSFARVGCVKAETMGEANRRANACDFRKQGAF